MRELFIVENVKCGGCTQAIEDGLKGLPGVTSVSAVIEGGQVTVEGEGLDRAVLSAKLAALGYPEA